MNQKMANNYIYISYKIDRLSYIKKRTVYNKTPVKYSSNKKYNNTLYHKNTNNSNSNYTETNETSFRATKNHLIEKNPEVNSFRSDQLSQRLTRTNQGEIHKKYYSKLGIDKMQYQFIKNYEINKNSLKQKKSQTHFSQKEYKYDISHRGNNNNIFFKEIKIKKKMDNNINDIYVKKYGDKTKNEKNRQSSSSSICMTEPSFMHNLNTNILNQYKINSILNSLPNNKKQNNSLSKRIYRNPKLKNILYKNNKKEINKTTENIDNKNKLDIIKKTYLKKFKILNEKDINNITNNNEEKKTFKYYLKNYKRAKINTKLTMKNLKALKLKLNNKKTVSDNIIRNIVKIQSIWRGVHFRKSFSFNLKLSIFNTIIYSIIEKYYKKYFMRLLNNNRKIEVNKKKYLKYLEKSNKKILNNNSLINEYSLPNKKNIQIKKICNSISHDNYKDYLNHFNSNLNILNNNQFIIEKIQLNKEDQNSISKYKITNNNLSLINKKCKIRKICHNESININENKSSDSKTIRKNRFKLERERQMNLSTEIRGKQRKKLKICIEYDLDDQNNNNINVLRTEKEIYNDKNNELIQINNNILSSLNPNFSLKENIDKIKETLESINQNSLLYQKKIDELKNIALINNNNLKNKKINLIIEKKENILLNQNKEKTKENNDINETNNGLNLKKYIKKDELDMNDKKEKQKSPIINEKNIVNNYNTNNEIDNKNGLEINPDEIKKTKNNNESISIQNRIQFLRKKKSNQNKNAKANMIKMILPIRIKTNIINNAKRNTFYTLIQKLKIIAFVCHVRTIQDKYLNKSKKYTFEKMKKMHFLYYKNYYLNQKITIKIKNLFKRYLIFKCANFLFELNKTK